MHAFDFPERGSGKTSAGSSGNGSGYRPSAVADNGLHRQHGGHSRFCQLGQAGIGKRDMGGDLEHQMASDRNFRTGSCLDAGEILWVCPLEDDRDGNSGRHSGNSVSRQSDSDLHRRFSRTRLLQQHGKESRTQKLV
ncbi:hypothetical protein SDC9_199769 [bioreactor metagenome]|uniref:Uncharacterized protein n=1 Tax=bioreactor metagenome TaxID=1076179 RepID=A0A645ILB9_9ZZZZ